MKNGLLKNISYALVANVFNAVATMITSLLIPRAFGSDIDSYGYFQVYFFYVSYVGFFHFGLCDGILLRIGGEHYSDLNRRLYSSQFWILAVFETVVSVLINVAIVFLTNNTIYVFVYSFVCCNLIILNLQTYILYILQGTSRIKEYSIITISYRALYTIFITVSLLFHYKNLYMYIIIDFISKLISVLVGMYWCKDIIFSKPIFSKEIFINLKENVSSGIKLLIANISGLLTNGIVRIGIQSHWSVGTYGKVSLSLTLTQIFLTIINAVSLVLYPTLRRTDKNQLPLVYKNIRNIVVYLIGTCFILYYPVYIVLSKWLPQYEDSLRFLGILLPLSLYNVKSSLLINTLLKVYRKEKTIMIANVVSIIAAVITTVISIYIFSNLVMALFAILINTIIKCIISDVSLSKVMDISIVKDVLEELFISVVFIISNWWLSGALGVLVFGIAISLMILLNYKKIYASFIGLNCQVKCNDVE